MNQESPDRKSQSQICEIEKYLEVQDSDNQLGNCENEKNLKNSSMPEIGTVNGLHKPIEQKTGQCSNSGCKTTRLEVEEPGAAGPCPLMVPSGQERDSLSDDNPKMSEIMTQRVPEHCVASSLAQNASSGHEPNSGTVNSGKGLSRETAAETASDDANSQLRSPELVWRCERNRKSHQGK